MATNGTSPQRSPEPPPRWTALRALIWKEWRQQRWVFVVAALMPIGVTLMARWIGDGDLTAFAGAASLGLAALLLGANAFTGEEEDRSAEFQRAMPISRGGVFWVKAGACLALLAAVSAFTVGAWVVLRGYLWPGGLPYAWVERAAPGDAALITTCVLSLGLFALLMVPGMVGGVTRRPLLCLLASILFVSVVWVSVLVPLTNSRVTPVLLANGGSVYVAPAVVAALLSTAAARLLWGWRRSLRSARDRLTLAVGVLLAFMSIGWGPVLTHFAYAAYVAPLSSYMGTGSQTDFLPGPETPEDRWCAVLVDHPLCPNRACLVEVESGRTLWVSRLTDTHLWPYWGSRWSPSGRRIILSTQGDRRPWRLWKGTATQEVLQPLTDFAFDRQTGHRFVFKDLWPGLFSGTPGTPPCLPCGWADDDTVTVSKGRDLYFLNVESREMRRCAWPASLSEFNPGWDLQQRSSDSWRVVVDPAGKGMGRLQFVRYAPDRAEAEVVTTGVAYVASPRFEISPDAQWAAVWREGSPGLRPTAVPLRRATEPTVVWDWDAGKELSQRWAFSAESSRLVGGDHYRTVVVDLKDMSRRSLPLLDVGDEPVNQYDSPFLSPGGRFVHCWVQSATAGGGRGKPVVNRVVNLESGRRWELPVKAFGLCRQWLDNERLITYPVNGVPYLVRYDGAERRPLLRE